MSCFGGSESGPGSIFCVASSMILEPWVTLPRASRTEGSICSTCFPSLSKSGVPGVGDAGNEESRHPRTCLLVQVPE